MPAKGKILVIRGGAIGDFILTLPVLSALRGHFPDAHIELLGYTNVTSLALASGLAHGSLSIESRALARFFAPKGDLDSKLCEYFSEFALIFSYLYDPDKFFESNVKSCFKGQFICGPHRPSDETVHATDLFLSPLRALAIFDADPQPRLHLPAPELSSDIWFAIHPGSGSEKKNWPIEAWLEFALALQSRRSGGVLLVGGEAEGDKLEYLSARLEPNRVKVLRSQPLVEVARHLQVCSAYIGHDSGISHLAAALGLKGLILWGETNAQIWRPRSPDMRLLEADCGLSNLKPQVVLDAFIEFITRQS